MNPVLPFAVLPLAVVAAWFAAARFSEPDPARYYVPAVAEVEDISGSVQVLPPEEVAPQINISAFLPRVPPKPPAPAPTMVLQSVMTSQDVRFATINGQVVQEGDRIQGYVVRHIAESGVQLESGGKPRHLPMRSLHELPPPSPRERDSANQNKDVRGNDQKLASDFWDVMNSKPRS